MADALTLSRPLDGMRRTAAQVKVRASRLWRAHPRETMGFGLLGTAVAVATGAWVRTACGATPRWWRAVPKGIHFSRN